jgi:glycosyltransferase involved in cell wall biosynthesis
VEDQFTPPLGRIAQGLGTPHKPVFSNSNGAAKMKVIHVPFSFYPDPAGGTETYVEALARHQQLRGVESVVAVPAARADQYSHNGIKVCRFPVEKVISNIRSLYGEGDAIASEGFARILESERPDLVHLHAFTRAISLRLVREAKRRGLPVVFTYHTPTVSCQRGTLLRWGSEVCNGKLDLRSCSQCALHGLGLNKPLSQLVGALPERIGRFVGLVGLSGGLWTAIRTTELLALQHTAFRSLMREVDRVIAVCRWVEELLLDNGVAQEKITVSRQGLCQSEVGPVAGPRRTSGTKVPIRIIFLGRLDPTKGVHVLIQALTSAPGMSAELDIYGVAQGEAGTAYLQRLKLLAGDDRRITFRDPIPAEGVVTRMCDYDLLAVPSQGLETGPMVVLEAFAAGIPVFGSNLGGIAELITHGVDGLLVSPASSPSAWRVVLEELCRDSGLLASLRSGIRPPRRIRDVAVDMAGLYATLVKRVSRADNATNSNEPRGTISQRVS